MSLMMNFFRPSRPLLMPALMNKHQIKFQRKLKEKQKRAQERKKMINKINNPAPEARWFHKPEWKAAVRAEKIKDIVREMRRSQIRAARSEVKNEVKDVDAKLEKTIKPLKSKTV
ncbi:hypothetical protein AKO1_006536 [Acrasis kona]|uniref:Coiled-coil domain-containing protein 86 n=1 Tax=Acrasis kona TaxID=1008807 RepID=A0AAW2ZLQ3_9EUKA